jgi:golgi apyrase
LEVVRDRTCIDGSFPSGISTFDKNPEDVGEKYLKELFQHAESQIPEGQWHDTPVFLLATAGMRLVEPTRRKILLDHICSYAQSHTKFQIPDCDLHVQVIPGETEGLYGWIAANYLLGGFDRPNTHDHGKGHHTYGFLDMGGASAQIAFAPNATEAEKHKNDLQLLRMRTLDGKASEYQVFVTTWLGFGVHQARERYIQALIAGKKNDEKELQDPCLPAGLKLKKEIPPLDGSDAKESKEYKLIGSGDFTQCLNATFPLLEKDAPCPDEPCLVNGQHVPAIDFDVNHFIGVSEYWHTTHEIFEFGHKDKAYDFATYQKRVDEFCSQSWSDIKAGVEKKKWGKKVDKQRAEEVCFKASWLINMLHDGIGIPRVGLEGIEAGHNGTKEVLSHAKQKGYLDPFQAVNKIKDTEVSWTLGKMVLYASSQVPPEDDVLAVGFGSNKPGIPDDFQYAGGSPIPLDADGEDAEWHDTLFKDSPRRIPGFLIFLLIVFIVFLMLCGRDRRKGLRQRFSRIIPGSHSNGRQSIAKRRRGILGKFFRSSGPSYERLANLEAGTAANEFELPEFDSDNEHSDSSEGSRVGRTSGWATPQIKAGAPIGFEPLPTYAENGASVMQQGIGLGLGPTNAIVRGGLMSRTESKERLTAERHGVRSRAGSPTRMRSPMVGFALKENVD